MMNESRQDDGPNYEADSEPEQEILVEELCTACKKPIHTNEARVRLTIAVVYHDACWYSRFSTC